MTTKLPYGHPSTLREGPFPCKGDDYVNSTPHTKMTPAQITWMKENKPKYFTGNLVNDLPHLPQHLRFD